MLDWQELPIPIEHLWFGAAVLGGLVHLVIALASALVVLRVKTNAASAVAWCGLILALPLLGLAAFCLCGRPAIDRGLRRKQRHRLAYRSAAGGGGPGLPGGPAGPEAVKAETVAQHLTLLAERLGAVPPARGNKVVFYQEAAAALTALLEVLRSAQQSVYLELFTLPADGSGEQILQILTDKARAAIKVRLLLDAVGTRRLSALKLGPLRRAGGKCSLFLPGSLLSSRRFHRRRRNQRSFLVVDGRLAFTGAVPRLSEHPDGPSSPDSERDMWARLDGPAAADLQRLFVEDWHFAQGDKLPVLSAAEAGMLKAGTQVVQVMESGPDQAPDGLHELLFAAIVSARERVWLAAPTFALDAPLLQALRLAANRGVDVRLLGPLQPRHWLPAYAARALWPVLLEAGVGIYQYTQGRLRLNLLLIDGQWAWSSTGCGGGQGPERHFAVSCLFSSASTVSELETAFQADLNEAIRLDRQVFAQRPTAGRMLENVAQMLLSAS